jgi:phasin family protein
MAEVITQNRRTSMPLRKASASKVAARGSPKKVAPAVAKPAVSITDAISETTQQSKTSAPVQEASAAKVAREGVEQFTPAAVEPVVTVIDAISETIQQPKASAQPQGASVTKVTVRGAVEYVIPAAAKPVGSATDAVSETITARPGAVAAVTEEMVKSIAPTKMTTPSHLLGINTMIKSTEDFAALGQANMEAFVRSGQIWAAGVQELMKQFAETTKASFDESVANLQAIGSTKSVSEAIDLQSKFATSVVEKALAVSNNLINKSIKLSEQTLAPITARVTSVVETFGKAA